MLSGPPPLVLSVWNVPYSRNVNFTGREEILREARRVEAALAPPAKEAGKATP